MIRNILLCSDGSPYSVVATEYALGLGKRLGATVTALHVTDIRLLEWPFLADLSGSIGAQPYQALLPKLQEIHKEKAKVILESIEEMARQRHVRCSTVHQTGRLTDIVLEEEKKADLVVIGQRGEHAEHTAELMGSSVERIVRRTIKPCLVTPEKFSEIAQIVVAYDGSKFAHKALEEAVQLAKALQVPLAIITVDVDGAPEWKSRLDEAVSFASSHDLAPNAELLEGNDEDEILKFAETRKMDLIVIGAYGHTRIREFILGSTTSHVIRKSHVPVLLVR